MISVSVIVPAYNAAQTLEDAIASLRAQTVREWEALIVDDGSTDETAAVATRFAKLDRRILLIRQPNGGVSAARNAGIEAASNEWLVFLDADDWLARDYLRRMRRPLVRDDRFDGVFCEAVDVAEDGRHVSVHAPPPREESFARAAKTCATAIHAALVRRSLVRSVGLFDTGLATCEDWDLWQRLARTTARFAVVQHALAFIRMSPASLSRVDMERVTADGLVVIQRGHRRDRRVPSPDPSWAEGYFAEDLPQALYNLVCWTAGLELAQGGQARRLLDKLPIETAPGLNPAALASSLGDGLPPGARRPPSESHRLWPEVRAELDSFLAALEQRSGEPALASRVQRCLEERVLRDADITEPITIGSAVGIRVDVAKPLPDIALPDDAERVVCRLVVQGRPATSLTLPVFGPIITADTLRHAIATDGQAGPLLLKRYLLSCGWRVPRVWYHLASLIVSKRALVFALSFIQANGSARPDRVRAFLLSIVRRAVSQWELLQPRSSGNDGAGRTVLHNKLPQADRARDSEVTGEDRDERDTFGPRYWEAIFATPNPWQYTSDYERTKYQQTLDLLPQNGQIRRALELACAEGHFTVELAGRVPELAACDISSTALGRARKRCVGLDHVTFMQLDLRQDPIPGKYDLIVCSEVLYYLGHARAVTKLARRLVEHLEPGGWLLMAHANVAAEDPKGTGFDWGHTIGALGVGRAVAAMPGLRLMKELRTPLYRIHLFRYLPDQPTRGGSPEVIERPLTARLDFRISAQVAWHGALGYKRTEVTERLPILMYHQIAPAGPEGPRRYRVTPEQLERQLTYLQRNGYYGITLETWRQAMESGRGLPGRAVMLTFDDGYRDFLTHAWPILQQYGFPVMVFVVPGRVGGKAEWDRAFGEPAPLMSWSELRRLAKDGVRFGSHSLDHSRMADLSASELTRQGVVSREILQDELSRSIDALAYPFGDYDDIVQRFMIDAGYEFGLTTDPMPCRLSSYRMNLPRLEVTGFDDIDRFAARLGRTCAHGSLRVVRNGLFDSLDFVRRLA